VKVFDEGDIVPDPVLWPFFSTGNRYPASQTRAILGLA
jgi:hypothetical protein